MSDREVIRNLAWVPVTIVASLLALIILTPFIANAGSVLSEFGLWAFQSGDLISRDEMNSNFDVLGQHKTAYESAIVIAEGGDILVGTAELNRKLAVTGRVHIGDDGSSAPEYAELSIENLDPHTNLAWVNNGQDKFDLYYDGSKLILNDKTLASEASEVMTWTHVGSVGVGTTAPRSRFHVSGGLLILEPFGNELPTCDASSRGATWICDSSAGGCPNISCPSHTGISNDHMYLCMRIDADDFQWSCLK